MDNRSATIGAAIDVGSNTIHVVVARCMGDTLDILADEVDLVRIGESVTATGEISEEKMRTALAVLKKYHALARKHRAREVFIVATEAIRQARNSAAFIERVRAETGLEMHLISGTAEAALTFLGATYEAGLAEHVSVMDLGGGSMELVSARDGHISWRTSVPLGSGWLHDRYLHGDPPGEGEIEEAETFLDGFFQKLKVKDAAPRLIATGGSANSLLALAHRAFHMSPEHHQLTTLELARCRHLLSALSAEDVASQYGQPLERARILLAGTLIIQHVMQRLNLTEIHVTSHGIREGMLLAYARYGEFWLDEVGREGREEDRYLESAEVELPKRLQSLLDWSEEVLKHEDDEAVHKMRVASRRLRAALDAYQPCCEPRRFAKLYKQIKQMATLLGEARDTDVLLLYLDEQLASLPVDEQAAVHWLMASLRDYRQQVQQDLTAFLEKLDGKKLTHLLKRSLEAGRSK